jgi:predicted SprT family Zn-dependent metalloprotease
MKASTIQNLADCSAQNTWDILCSLYPKHLNKTAPKVVLNKRLKTTAGRAFIAHDPQYIDLSVELMEQYLNEFCTVIIPHELAHCVAFLVYNDPGHGKHWKRIMKELGLIPERCHNMVNYKRV